MATPYVQLKAWRWSEVRILNDISSEITHQIHSIKFMYTPREGLYQNG